MLTGQIPLPPGVVVRAAHITDHRAIQESLTGLEIPHPRSVIVLLGGAGGIGWLDNFPMRKVIRIVAKLAEDTQSVIVDGGTQAGIMTEIGLQCRLDK